MLLFQFNGKHLFTWADQAGHEQTLDLQNSKCNHKSGVLRHDHAQITTKNLLPVTKLFYGPLEFQPEQMTIIVGSLVCQFNEIETDYKIEDHVTEHDTAIGTLFLEQNRTNEIIGDYSQKLDDLQTKIARDLGNFQTALQEHGENYTNDINDIITGGFHLNLF